MSTLQEVVELKLPARAEYISVARLLISAIGMRIGFSIDKIEEIKVSVGEACTNVVNHAYPPHQQGIIKIDCKLDGDYLEINVRDEGESRKLEWIQKPFERITKETEVGGIKAGGFGLYLINSLMDHVEISYNNGIQVKMIKYLTLQR